VLDPDAGLGYPAGYPGSILPVPTPDLSERDERLLALAWHAMVDGTREIVLTEEHVLALTDDRFDERYIPPHVELSARIHAASSQALERDDYRLTIAPARSAGTLTSRFTPMATGSGLARAYRALPAATEGALRVQMSFAPVYPHAENVCRVPAYLDHVLPLGEHRDPGDGTLLRMDDLAITATSDRLHLISISRRRVVEPQVFHALALDKQPSPLARFLAQLPRAFSAAWYQFDWGPHARLPFLPRVRYRRTVLSLAQWWLTASDLPPGEVGPDGRRQALDQWRHRWDCPGVVELRDADRTLRLTLDEPAHAALLHAHLTRHGRAILTEATPAAEFGWIDGHAHELALPLITTRTTAPYPLHGHLPLVTNTHGHLPGSPEATWLYVKIHTHPERMDEIIAEHLPTLLATPGNLPWWFVRYHSPHETAHLRLRIRTNRGHYASCAAVIGEWSQRMRQTGMVGRLVIDTYYPETGRYGHAAAMDAAEEIFAADSQTVSAGLRNLPATVVHPTALAVANMVHITSGFLGDLAAAMDWLAARPAPAAPATDRAVTDQAIRLATRNGALRELAGCTGEIDQVRQARTKALAAYRKQLPPDADVDTVLESLLHMHHNRAIGINPDSERTCRRLARQAARTWRVRQAGDGQ
ncbi:MAG: lantibiotic dehydratase, partial [Pseudonocardiaceae bacterium]